MSQSASALFDANYFKQGCGPAPYERNEGWLKFFDGIAERIVSYIAPASVLDAGCAMGFLVERLRDRGVDASGIDISEYALQQVRADIQPYCWQGSVTDPFPRRYALIVSIEVLEHLPQAASEQAIANFCQHTDDVLFSSTPADYKEVTHFNVQPPEYWAEQFARHGFFRDTDFDASFITPWAVRFRRRQEPVTRVVREYERHFWLRWKESVDLRQLVGEMRQDINRWEQTATHWQNAVQQAQAALQQTQAALQQTQGDLQQTQGDLQQTLAALQQAQMALAQTQARGATLQGQLNAITESAAWKILSRLQHGIGRLAPGGSRRARAVLALQSTLRRWLGKG